MNNSPKVVIKKKRRKEEPTFKVSYETDNGIEVGYVKQSQLETPRAGWYYDKRFYD